MMESPRSSQALSKDTFLPMPEGRRNLPSIALHVTSDFRKNGMLQGLDRVYALLLGRIPVPKGAPLKYIRLQCYLARCNARVSVVTRIAATLRSYLMR